MPRLTLPIPHPSEQATINQVFAFQTLLDPEKKSTGQQIRERISKARQHPTNPFPRTVSRGAVPTVAVWVWFNLLLPHQARDPRWLPLNAEAREVTGTVPIPVVPAEAIDFTALQRSVQQIGRAG